jgi:hypothetical protein
MIDAEAEHGSARVSLGSVSIDTLSVGAAMLQHAWSKIGLHVGVGARVGALYLSGEPDSMGSVRGGSGWAPWGGPMGVASASFVAARYLAVDLAVEIGYVVAPAGGLVAGSREVAIEGPWIGIQLGARFFL